MKEFITLQTVRLFLIAALVQLAVNAPTAFANDFDSAIKPLLAKYCVRCHGDGEEINGDVDFTKMNSPAQINASFDVWQTAIELVTDDVMPPADEPQPSDAEKAILSEWYQQRFVESVEAHPGFFRPRRLSAYEYRNTLHSLLGFPLEVVIREAEQTVTEKSLVLKLLPTDPPGPSGFTNDTSGNPLTTVIWDQYSYLVDNALSKMFSRRHRDALEAYTGTIEGEGLTQRQADKVLQEFARLAHRRPVDEATLAESLIAFDGKAGDELERALRVELKTILMSPSYIYRGLQMDVPHDVVTSVDDFELAERLSYLLWADMPDEELMQLAASGSLSDDETYRDQIDRMLAAPKARSLAENMGVEWFSLNEIEHASNNPPVTDALRSQPIDFLHYLFTERRPLIELIDSNVTFINPHTAKYYPVDRKQMSKYQKQRGIEVESLPNQRIDLVNTTERGGLLTMPGILSMNKGPVLRGTWMLERVLGQHLPDPPANVGQVPTNQRGENLTFRQRFEMHRSNPTCAVCHDKIDPLGFALQAYDVGGGYMKSANYNSMKAKVRKADRDKLELTAAEIDTSGQMPTGELFEDFAGLKRILVTSQRERVIRNIVRRMMAYALCRKLELYDGPTVEKIVTEMDERDGTFHDLIHAIAGSLPFKQTVVSSQ